MRRLTSMLAAAALALALAVAWAGCGSDDSGGGGSLDEVLGYLPEDAPLVITIDTDVEGDQFKAIESILKKFPFGEQVRDGLLEELEVKGDFERDVKPILGNEFVVGSPDVAALTAEDSGFVGALEARDGDKLVSTIEKEGAEETGEKNGATLYEDDDGDAFAVDGDTLVVAASTELLEGALEQHDGDGALDEDTFEEGLEDLPDDALLKVYGDAGRLLEEDPETEQARKVAWVGALETFGLTASVQEDEIAIDFEVKTGGDLGEEDLPLAAGEESPGVVQRENEVGVGLRDLNQIYRFALTAAQAVDPSGFGQFETGKTQIEQRLGVSIDDDVFGQLAGDVAVSFGLFGGGFGARAELKDPDAFRQTLEKAGPVIPSILEGATGLPTRLVKPDGGEGLYRLEQPSSGETFSFGVLNDVLVVSNDPATAEELAEAEPEQVEGAEGAVSLRLDTEELANGILERMGGVESIGGALFTRPLGDLTGSIESSSDGLRGRFTLAIE